MRVLFTLFLAGGAAAILAGPVQAAPDCAPLGHLPSYDAGDAPEMRNYAAADFTVQKGDDTEMVTVIGRRCTQSYHVKDGADPLSDLEIQSNYRSQIKALGGETLFTDDRNTVAKIVKNGEETWLMVSSQESAIDTAVVVKTAFKATLLPPSGKDYSLIGHLPDYEAGDVEKKNFDQLEFTIKDGDDTKTVKVQGAKYVVSYHPKDGAPVASDLEIQENYRAALKALGGETLFADERSTVSRVKKDNQTVWIGVYSQESTIDINVIEEKPFEPTIKPPQ